MATGISAPQDLGRLASVSKEEIEPGVILWERFCVVGRRRESERFTNVAVTDLHRSLGDPETHHRLELHLLDVEDEQDVARLRRALTLATRVQPTLHAIIETGTRIAAVCDVPLGSQLDTGQIAIGAAGVVRRAAPLDRRSLLLLASDLAALLGKLHEAEVFGVAFDPRQLRVQRGRFSLDGFEHLLVDDRDPDHDIERLLDLLTDLGGDAAATIREPKPESARELWQRIRALAGDHLLFAEVELPSEPPFVGRASTLATLSEGLLRAEIAQPSVYVVRGRRGVGKSRVLREFVANRLACNDAFVLTGTWQPHSAETRGGLLGALDQLARTLRTLDPTEREAVRQRINRSIRNLGAVVTKSAPALGNVLRSMEELPQLELGEDFSRHTVVIGDLLRALGTQRRPLVLVLDNLEEADSSSLTVLRLLAQARPAHHTFVIAGLRDEDDQFKPDFPVQFVELPPLEPSDVASLLKRTLPGSIADLEELTDALWSVSSGYPLAIWANLRAWLDHGLLVLGSEDAIWRARKHLREGLDLEPNIRDLFGFRLAGTSEEVRLLVLRMSVLGLELRISDLVELIDDPASLDESLLALSERGILTRSDQLVRFPHDSVRELVLELADPAQRRDAHRVVAALLERRKAPIAQIAYHRDLAFDESVAGPEDFDNLSRLHVEAGRERLGVYDLERGRWHLERALERSRDPDQRSIAAEGLADICLLSNDLESAVELYTALIATAEPERAVHVATKASHFLFSKTQMKEAQALGQMALERVAEPLPTSNLGRLAVTLISVIGSMFFTPRTPIPLREALSRLYPQMIVSVLVSEPMLVIMFTARVRWLYRGLRTGPTTVARSFEAALRATMGHYSASDKLFSDALEIATDAKDTWGRAVVLHNWAHLCMLPSGRYEQGQRMLDEAVDLFRQTGDVSISIISMMMRCIYGRDRESTETLLGWIEEGVSMARRHGREILLASFEAMRVAVLARQGRSDAEARLLNVAVSIEAPELSPTERLISRTHLAYAALDVGEVEFAFTQVRLGQLELAELPGVPEFCQELHAATAFVILTRSFPSREERRMHRSALRKLRRAARASPRLKVLTDLYELKRAVAERNTKEVLERADRVLGELDKHGNLYAAREAHRALAQVLKAQNVLAAAEHERIVRNLGRRLGLGNHALTSEFVEPELAGLPLGNPTLGSLTDSVVRAALEPSARESGPSFSAVDHEILAAWSLDDTRSQATKLADVIAPLRTTVAPSLGPVDLQIECPEPDFEVPISPSDLQVLLVNMLLTARDAVGGQARIEMRLQSEAFGVGDLGEFPQANPGRYLAASVRASGRGTDVPMLGGFKACEELCAGLGGFFQASTDRHSVRLISHLPVKVRDTRSDRTIKVVVVHGDEAIRQTMVSALIQLGATPQAVSPNQFEPELIEGSVLLLADGKTLDSLRVLEPLLETHLVEIVRRGTPAVLEAGKTLGVPFALSELEDLLHEASNNRSKPKQA